MEEFYKWFCYALPFFLTDLEEMSDSAERSKLMSELMKGLGKGYGGDWARYNIIDKVSVGSKNVGKYCSFHLDGINYYKGVLLCSRPNENPSVYTKK